MSDSLLAYMTGDEPHPHPYAANKRPSIGPGKNFFRSPEEESALRKQMMEIQVSEVSRGQGEFVHEGVAQMGGGGGGSAEPGVAVTSSTSESSEKAGAYRILPPPPLPPSAYGYAPPPLSNTHQPLPSKFAPPLIRALPSPPLPPQQPLPSQPPSYPVHLPQSPPPARDEFNPRFRYPSLGGSTTVISQSAGERKYYIHEDKQESVSVIPSNWSSQHELDDDQYLIGTSEEKGKWKKKAFWWILILVVVVGAGVVVGVEVNKKHAIESSAGQELAGAGEGNSTSVGTTTSAELPLSSTAATSKITTNKPSQISTKLSTTTTAKPSTTSKAKVEVITTTTNRLRTTKSSSTTTAPTTTTTTKAKASVTCTVPIVANGFTVAANIETLRPGAACPTATTISGNHFGGGGFIRKH